jgi:hypothetical protein
VVLDRDIPAFDIAGFAKSLEERDNTIPPGIGRSDVQEGYHWHRRLLRARSERPREPSAADERDELASFPSMEMHTSPNEP